MVTGLSNSQGGCTGRAAQGHNSHIATVDSTAGKADWDESLFLNDIFNPKLFWSMTGRLGGGKCLKNMEREGTQNKFIKVQGAKKVKADHVAHAEHFVNRYREDKAPC